ncbi:hypothetical protein SDC9_170418 [bioreactor metagenome]|uniref:Uncharacterized protein n=1 Tax=bioreactor metagenome TaxID=1076179 RepID=A0A645GH14_9ZZZZ
MAERFAILTKYIPQFTHIKYGDWVIDKENDGTPEHPIQMPFVNYSDIVSAFIQDVYRFMDDNEDLELNHYGEILENNGLDLDSNTIKDEDVSSMDAQCVLALIMGAVRAERFCDGALLDFFKSGCILKWIDRLNNIE